MEIQKITTTLIKSLRLCASVVNRVTGEGVNYSILFSRSQ